MQNRFLVQYTGDVRAVNFDIGAYVFISNGLPLLNDDMQKVFVICIETDR
jgi:hypothetical protein